MIRFRSISIALVVGALAVSARAQGTTGGLLYASDFANWTLPQGNTPAQGAIFYPNQDICKVTSNGYTFLAPRVGRPITIVDGANTETVTPTNVVIGSIGCSISAIMAHSHSSYFLKSGTAGAQEAIDYQASQPQGANIILTPTWTTAGGSTGIITGTLKGNAGVTILDQRTAALLPYAWNGSNYVPQAFLSGVTASPQFSLFYQPNPGTTAAAVGDPNITTDGAGNMHAGTVAAAATVAGAVNNTLYAGTAAYPTINLALAALPPTGGTIVTPPLYSETVTNLAVGSITQPVALVLGAGSIITITGTSGVQVFNSSSIRCDGVYDGPNCQIVSHQTGTVNSLFANGQQDGTQEYFNATGLTFDCQGSPSGSVTFTNGCVDLNGIFVPSALKDSIIYRFTNNIGLHIHNSTGTNGGTNVVSFWNLWVNGGGNAGARPVVIERDSTGTVSVINDYAGAIEHAGPGFHELEINGHGTTFALFQVNLFGTQMESTGSQSVASAYIVDAAGVGFHGVHFSGHSAGQPCIELAQTVSNGLGPFVADNIRCNTAINTPAIKNDVSGYQTPNGQLWETRYSYPTMVVDGTTTFTNPVALSSSAYSPAASAGVNFLVTAGIAPSFETGSATLGTGWTSQCGGDPGCVFLRDNSTAPVSGGTFSQKITVATASGRDTVYATNGAWAITSGNTYIISFWAKNDGGALKATMHLADAGETTDYCGQGAQNFTLTSTWQPFVYICKATASGTSVLLRLSNQIGVGTGDMWLDLVNLALAPSPAYAGFGALASGNADASTLTLSAGNVLGCTTATTSQLGCVKPDGTSIAIDGNGVLSGIALVPTVAQAGGDLVCAVAADATIHPVTLTGVASTASTLTYTMAAVPSDFYVGQIVQTQGNTTTAYNIAPLTIASVTSTTVVITNASNPGAGTAGGTMSLYCSNQVNDALVATKGFFANKFTVPANYFSAGKVARIATHMTWYTPATAASFLMGAFQNSSTPLSNMTGQLLAPTAALTTGRTGYLEFQLTGQTSTLIGIDASSSLWPSASITASQFVNGVSQPVTISASSLSIGMGMYYNPTGVASGTYTSGITATGTVGQTCNLTAFNNSSTATATVALTGTNTIAGGTALVITARGAAASAAPTTATAGNGTATCSGTATIATVLGGSPGNAVLQRSFVWMPY